MATGSPRLRFHCVSIVAGPHGCAAAKSLKDLRLLGCTVTTPAVFARLVGLIQAGELHPLIRAVYPLADIAVAQSDFLGKAQTGKIVLVP